MRDAVNSARANANSAVPAELKQECPPLPMTDGSLANLARLAVEDAREYAKCRERHNALVDVVNEIERLMK